MTPSTVDILLFAAKLGLVFFVILTLAAYLVFAERKILAWIQDRKGPNRVGPFGLLQPLADLIKLLTKEDVVPAAADRWLFYLAPAMAAIPAILTFAVIPFGAPLTIAGRPLPLLVADLAYAHETVGNCEAVSFFDPRDPAELARQMASFERGEPICRPVSVDRPKEPFAANWTALLQMLTDGL